MLSIKTFVKYCVFFIFILGVFVPIAQAQTVIQKTDPELRMKWYNEHVAMKEQSPFKDSEWSFIGPTNVSGRVVDVDLGMIVLLHLR